MLERLEAFAEIAGKDEHNLHVARFETPLRGSDGPLLRARVADGRLVRRCPRAVGRRRLLGAIPRRRRDKLQLDALRVLRIVE